MSFRLSAAIAVVAALILGLGGALQLRAEDQELRGAVSEQMSLVANSVRVAAENALRDAQPQDLVDQLKALEVVQPNVDVYVYSLDGSERTVGVPRTPISAERRRRAVERARTADGLVLEFSDGERGDVGYVFAAAPLEDDDGAPLGSLVVVRSLAELAEDLRSTRRNILAIVLVFVVSITGISFLLGELYIGKRLARLSRALRRVREGETDVHVSPGPLDEVGQVVTEFDAMAAALASTRGALETELEARRRSERALQHADKLIAVGQLSATLAHEIGSPLQILAGRARALVNNPGDPERTRRNARILADQADRIARIVQNLLLFSRPRAAPRAFVDIEKVVAEVLELMQLETRRREVDLSLSVDGVLPPVLASADQLQQVTFNLVRNSMAATETGGRIRVSLEACAEKGSGGVRLTVNDDGRGISGPVLEHLFEPFFTTRSTEDGSGLGLAVVKSIVQDHGGTIRVASEEGIGTSVVIWLPLSGAQSEAIALNA